MKSKRKEMKRSPGPPSKNKSSQKASSKLINEEHSKDFATISGIGVKPLYSPDEIRDFNHDVDLGRPGEYPYTRGIHPNMYQSRLWTIRQFSGYGTPEETNQRLRYLLMQGQTGLSIAFDLPTLMGYDSDHPAAEGEVGKCGVSVSSLADMEALLKDLPVEKVATSMTINSPAAIIWAMYLVAIEKRGISWNEVTGTIQNDILKEYMAQKEYIFPPRPSMRLVVDTIEFGTQNTPQWNTVSISGYHIREAGSTALQELAFTLRSGIEYAQWTVNRGLSIDEFAPRFSFFFNAHNDFFEEIAKYRAARKIWAKVMRERFGAKNPSSLKCRFHSQTAGCSLTAKQPYANVVRTTIQALAAVLGGTQSLHTNSLDEALALPTKNAATIALRTQQILAHETGVTKTTDPLGGSYFLEKMTLELEKACLEYIDRIDSCGGMVSAIEQGIPQREIVDSSYEYQKAMDLGKIKVSGINIFNEETPQAPKGSLNTLKVDEAGAKYQRDRLNQVRKSRSIDRVNETLNALSEAAKGKDNIMPYILNCVRAYATVGEMCDILKSVFGTYQETGYH